MIASNSGDGKKKKRNPKNTIPAAARHKRCERFLKALRDNGGCVHSARLMSGLCRKTCERWRGKYPKFAEAIEKAKAEGMIRVEEEAIRRAYAGVAKPVYYKGEVVGEITEYSDRLIEFILKGHFPEKYKEKYRDAPETSNDIPIGTNIYDAIRNPTTAPAPSVN